MTRYSSGGSSGYNETRDASDDAVIRANTAQAAINGIHIEGILKALKKWFEDANKEDKEYWVEQNDLTREILHILQEERGGFGAGGKPDNPNPPPFPFGGGPSGGDSSPNSPYQKLQESIDNLANIMQGFTSKSTATAKIMEKLTTNIGELAGQSEDKNVKTSSGIAGGITIGAGVGLLAPVIGPAIGAAIGGIGGIIVSALAGEKEKGQKVEVTNWSDFEFTPTEDTTLGDVVTNAIKGASWLVLPSFLTSGFFKKENKDQSFQISNWDGSGIPTLITETVHMANVLEEINRTLGGAEVERSQEEPGKSAFSIPILAPVVAVISAMTNALSAYLNPPEELGTAEEAPGIINQLVGINDVLHQYLPILITRLGGCEIELIAIRERMQSLMDVFSQIEISVGGSSDWSKTTADYVFGVGEVLTRIESVQKQVSHSLMDLVSANQLERESLSNIEQSIDGFVNTISQMIESDKNAVESEEMIEQQELNFPESSPGQVQVQSLPEQFTINIIQPLILAIQNGTAQTLQATSQVVEKLIEANKHLERLAIPEASAESDYVVAGGGMPRHPKGTSEIDEKGKKKGGRVMSPEEVEKANTPEFEFDWEGNPEPIEFPNEPEIIPPVVPEEDFGTDLLTNSEEPNEDFLDPYKNEPPFAKGGFARFATGGKLHYNMGGEEEEHHATGGYASGGILKKIAAPFKMLKEVVSGDTALAIAMSLGIMGAGGEKPKDKQIEQAQKTYLKYGTVSGREKKEKTQDKTQSSDEVETFAFGGFASHYEGGGLNSAGEVQGQTGIGENEDNVDVFVPQDSFIVNKKSSEKHSGLLSMLSDNFGSAEGGTHIKATKGEKVIPPDTAKKHGRLLEAINADHFAWGGFAGGGGVPHFDVGGGVDVIGGLVPVIAPLLPALAGLGAVLVGLVPALAAFGPALAAVTPALVALAATTYVTKTAFETLVGIIGVLTDGISFVVGAFEHVAEGVGHLALAPLEGMLSIVGAVNDVLGKLASGDVYGAVAAGAQSILGAFTSVGNALVGWIPVLGGIFGQLTGIISGAISSFAQFMGVTNSFVQKINPALVEQWNNQVANLQATIGVAFQGLVGIMSDTIMKMGGILLPIAEELAPIFNELGELMQSTLLPIFKVFATIIQVAIAPVQQAFNYLRIVIIDAVKSFVILAAVVARMFGANDFIQRLIANLQRPDQQGALAVGNTSIGSFENVAKDLALAAAQSSVAGAGNAPRNPADIMGDVLAEIRNIRTETLDDLLDRIEQMIENFKDNVEGWWNDAKKLIEDWFKDNEANITAVINNVFDRVWRVISAWFEARFPNIAHPIREVQRGIGDAEDRATGGALTALGTWLGNNTNFGGN